MEKWFFVHLSFVFLCLILNAVGIGACSPSGAPCTKNEDCCSISSGRPYCNGLIGRCEASRYCDKSSPNPCPFDDLTIKEIEKAIQIIKGYKCLGTNLEFSYIRKQEPKKQQWNAGDRAAFQRIAYAVVFDVDSNRTYDVLISLTKQRVISAIYRPDSLPPLSSYEYKIATEIGLADHRVTNAYQVRGLNASYAAIDVWAFGAQGSTNGRRLVKLVFNYKDPETRYMVWRPIEGLIATVDIEQKRIIDFTDIKRDVPVPTSPLSNSDHEMHSGNMHPSDSVPPPPPSSIEVDGFNVKWENWKFQYSMDPVHGLQLYHVRYTGDCKERFLIYKISISEMFVPYGASGKHWRWKGAFDAGEYKLGASASPMMLGVDVPSNAILFSCPMLNDATGEVTEMQGCFAMYERPVLPLYYHYDAGSGTHDAKSGKELVIAFTSTIGNYDYMWEYVCSLDGSIMAMVMATGILLPRAVLNRKNDPNCIEDCMDYIHENAIAPLHQHYVNFRIDFDIDGASNMFTQVDFVRDPISSDNLDGGAFSLHRTVIPRETFLDSSPANARFWTIINTQSRNDFNTPRGYSIHPGSTTPTFLLDGNPLNQAQFIKHPIWVTTYNDDEQGAAGNFSRTGENNQGLREYVDDSAPLRNVDIVVWHSLAFSHAPRPEEYPFMNRHMAAFHLMPRNFMSANPMVKVRCRDSTNFLSSLFSTIVNI